MRILLLEDTFRHRRAIAHMTAIVLVLTLAAFGGSSCHGTCGCR